MYKIILLAVDLNHDAGYLIEKVHCLRELSAARLHLVHVVEPLPSCSYAYLGIIDIETQLCAEAGKQLASFAAPLNVAPECQHVLIGATKLEILKLAADLNADLLICGSHGRHGLSALLGSTANAIVHSAACDVLTIRLPNHAV